MPKLLRIIRKAPLPVRLRLSWQRVLIVRSFNKDIDLARREKDLKKIRSIESDLQFELMMLSEEEDSYLTKQICSKARRLLIPIPRKHNIDNSESELWYEGQYYGSWHLTDQGISFLRSEIRREKNARHEARAQLIPWVIALTGLIGSITGLVALLKSK